jgi:hypothetical protein
MDFDKQQPATADPGAAALSSAAVGIVEAPKPADAPTAVQPTQASPEKLQWPGVLLHIFTNAAKQHGDPPDRDKSNLS